MIALRPRSVPELIDAAFALLRGEWLVCFALGALFFLPVHGPRLVRDFLPASSPWGELFPEPRLGILWWELWSTFAVTAASVAAALRYEGRAPTASSTIARMRSVAGRMLVTAAVVELLYDVAVIPFVFPGLIVLVLFVAAVPASVVERALPWRALRRSAWLARGNAGRVLLASGFVWGLTAFLDPAGVDLVFSLTKNPVASGAFDYVWDILLYSLRGITATVIYFDLRIRREAYDIERLMASSS
jgi:hypothetical protein